MKTNIYLYSSFCNYFCLIYFFWTYLKACKTVFCYKFFLVLFVAFLNSNVSEHHLKSLHAFYTIYLHVSRWCRGLFLLETFHFVSFIFFSQESNCLLDANQLLQEYILCIQRRKSF